MKAYTHWLILQDEPLLYFLTRGDIEFFLFVDDLSGITLKPHEEQQLRAFISRPFAQQYDFLLARAVEQRLVSVAEVLLTGRRWVLPQHEEVCFEATSRRLDELVTLLRSLVADAAGRKVTLAEVAGFLRQHSVRELFDLLQPPLARHRTGLLMSLRDLAVVSYNEHGDTDLAKGILDLCSQFKSPGA